MRRNLIWILGVAALVAFTSVASAHLLSFRRAHNVAQTEAREECNSFATCTHYGARSCQRLNAHKIRCTAIVRDEAGGSCRWPVTVRMARGSFRLFVNSDPDQTAVCRQG
jgi:hypothetical protein